MCLGGGGPDPAEEARKEQQAREAKIRLGMGNINGAFSQFDDSWFNGRRQAYLDFSLPQLEDQYGKARQSLIYALARGGNLQSSIGAGKLGDLKTQYETNKQQLQSQADAVANQARQDVIQQRSALIDQLNSTADANAAQTEAMNRARLLTASPTFSALGQLFQNVTAGLASAAPASGYAGAASPIFQSAASGASGSQRIVS